MINADWTPDIWTWTPKQGLWSPEYGAPKKCVLLNLSTTGVAPREAFDYWRATVFHDFHADRPAPELKDTFRAEASGLISPGGALLWYRSDPISGHRGRCRRHQDEFPEVALGLVLEGNREQQQAGDRAVRTGPGEPFFYDPSQPAQVRWQAHRGLHLTLDREAVRHALGGEPPLSSQLIAALRRSSLYPFLHTQLRLLAQYGAHLNPTQRDLLVDQLVHLALGTLNTLAPRPMEDRGSLLFAARQLIERNLADPDLNVDNLAARLACSRATLYRAFADHDLSVAAYLREARLRRVRTLLIDAPDHWSIADIAARCGFIDSASFSRQFRQRYGVRPRDVRQSHRVS
jgi:AraC-like DNA-binding protein